MNAPLDAEEVQSLVFSGHGRKPSSLAVWLRVNEADTARASMRSVVQEKVSFGMGGGSRASAVQILLSARGIEVLRSDAQATADLSRPFRQGMVTPQRSRALGDSGANDPSLWQWNDSENHAVVLLFGSTEQGTIKEWDAIRATLVPGWEVKGSITTRLPSDAREPFGFRDGISRVRVDLGNKGPEDDGVEVLPPGEILFGHRTVAGILSLPAEGLFRNSAYVVVRQLEQDVERFWRFWRDNSRDDEEALWLASKAVGRWPNGMPVSGSSPQPQPPADEAALLAPIKFSTDPTGVQCPFGAHIRRANPRDGMRQDPVMSLRLGAQRRLMRRGRIYGPPAPASWYPEGARTAGAEARDADTTHDRGLLFIALCSDLARQFEFIQQTWLNNPKQAGLSEEADPISAGENIVGNERNFTIPREAFRRRVCGLQHWIKMRGGGYFLLPGRQALAGVLAD